MNIIELEIDRCKQIEKASADRNLPLAAQAFAGRRTALEWALANLNTPAPQPNTKPTPAPPAKAGKK